ncbi:MAG: hypothetical protein EON93_06410 [Burkholderiales bacterium]|nr:MAG: hypothetical protein EON93_06410 [Burkholderiales bacterium]
MMTPAMPDPSTRRALWWARSFGRPLQEQFTPANDETPDELNELLQLADKRMDASRKPEDS